MRKLRSLFVVIVVGFLAIIAWYNLSLRAVSAEEARVTITIPSGSSTQQIAEMLEEKELIRSASAFKIHAKKSGKAGAMQAGSFILMKNMSTPEIVSTLSSGEVKEASVTIPEGYTVKDIDALLAEKGLMEAGELIDCASSCDFSTFDFLPSGSGLAPRGGRVEGYLYPDTYFVDTTNFVPKFFIERLLNTFRSRVIEDLAADIAASSRSLHEIVTMASLIEEETRTDDERGIVSGILWKRFDEGMGLGVDATVRYILDKQTAALTTADLNHDSPYNLRKFRGLPPGPIASPSLSSIKAALHPEDSPYWYYLHGTDGVIRYAVTNEEHNLNKYEYLR